MLCLCHILDLQARVRELEEQLRGAVETMGSVEEASSRDMAQIINDVSERADQRIQELLGELR
jgi:division protein CdvB (Snf7/Vps24/ESCRT-III family)